MEGRKKREKRKQGKKEERMEQIFFQKKKFFTAGDRLQKTTIAFNEIRRVIVKL